VYLNVHIGKIKIWFESIQWCIKWCQDDYILKSPYSKLSRALYIVESEKIQNIYTDLITLDCSKRNCIFNKKSICNQYEFVVETVKIFHNSLVAFKVVNKLNQCLQRKKDAVEQSKEITENQHFWSWIPGSLCLVQMPFSYVTTLKILPVERAIILHSEAAMTENNALPFSQRFLIHFTWLTTIMR